MTEKIGNTLVICLARGFSLRRWAQSGLIDREWELYARLAPYYERLMVVTWGDARDRQIAAAITGEPTVIANEAGVP
ncbi:MAG: hypothetical protein KDA28_13190, partial [Phycisphaerales bacterium]|nr:hypothetical protein [Phycisphaerales bacterium]